MRSTGSVRWFNDLRGFGFIAPENGQAECFVHRSAIEGGDGGALADGERVEFDIVPGRHGPSAANVRRLRG
jgi:CspA family cold shock protein